MSEKIKKQLLRDSRPELQLDPDVVQPGIFKWPPHFTPTLLLVVFFGGCAGTLTRYYVARRLPVLPGHWPTSTFIVNLLGALLLGLLVERLAWLGPDSGARRTIRLGLGTGFLGGFTTYSSFAVELGLLVKGGHLSLACLYAAATLAGGLLCSVTGIALAASHHNSRGNGSL